MILAKARPLYASFVSLILQALGFTVLMLLKWCVLSTLFSGKNAQPSSSFRCTFSMTALFTSQNGVRLQHSTLVSTRSFCESILLFAPEGAELRLVRTVGMVSLHEILFETLKQKMALTLRPPPQVYCSPSCAQANAIIKPI